MSRPCVWSVAGVPCFQLKEEQSVHGSDEEVDDAPEVDTDDDTSDDEQKQIHEEVLVRGSYLNHHGSLDACLLEVLLFLSKIT